MIVLSFCVSLELVSLVVVIIVISLLSFMMLLVLVDVSLIWEVIISLCCSLVLLDCSEVVLTVVICVVG